MTKLILGFILTLVLSACTRESNVKIYTLDKKNCITVITENNTRYIIAGEKEVLTSDNYIKLDISNVDKLNNCIWIHWLNNDGWDMVIDDAIIIENRLDTNKYIFNTKLPTDSRGIPTEIKFRKANCAIFDYYTMSISPENGTIIELF